jgi:Tol biopolymer transport system component
MVTAFGYPRWSPDSRYVYLPAFDEKGEQLGNHRIDVRDATVTPVVTDRPGELGGHVLTPDGNAIILARHGDRATSWLVTVRDLEGGDEEELYRADNERFYSMAISPDGGQLAIISRPLDGQGTGSCIRVGPTAGGELREVCRLEKVARHVAWTADGSHVLFCMRMPDEDKWGLWQVSARGGEPEDLHTVMVGELRHLTVHPDGTQIAFQSSGPIKNAELWAIENIAGELDMP